MPPDLSVPAIQDIFVYRPGAIGDTLLTLPALAALRWRFPGCRVTFAGNPACLPLLPVDQALASDDPRLLGLFEEPPRTWRPFDYHVIFAAEPRGLLPGLRRSAREAASHSQHVADWLVDAIDPTFLDREPRLALAAPAGRLAAGEAPRTEDASQTLFSETAAGVDSGKRLVLHVGAGSAAKCWPAECFARLAVALGMPLAVVRGPADGPAVDRFLEQLPGHLPGAEVWSGLTLVELAARLGGAALFVGNDSGITHLAAALGVPSLALHIASDPAIWGIRGARTRCLAGTSVTVAGALAACWVLRQLSA